MENNTALPNGTDQRQQGERRSSESQVQPEPGKERRRGVDRRAHDWRRAADRMERAGRPVTALIFNNEAAHVEGETR